jgi:hypothetical protein
VFFGEVRGLPIDAVDELDVLGKLETEGTFEVVLVADIGSAATHECECQRRRGEGMTLHGGRPSFQFFTSSTPG